MRAMGAFAASVGAFGGALGGAVLGWFLVDPAAVWAAALAGAVAGWAGGTCGRNLAEGVVVASLGLGLLALTAVVPFPVPWLPAVVVGLFVGNGVGWVSHGRLA